MTKHFHFDLRNLPIIMWPVIIMIIVMVVGKLADVPLLFTLGSWGLGIIGVLTIIALVKEFL